MRRQAVTSIVLIFLLIPLVTLLAQEAKLVLVRQITPTFPDSLYKSVGTRTFNVQYIQLFLEQDYKAYIVKAWRFQPTGAAFNYIVKLVDPVSKKEYVYQFPGIRSASYVRLAPVLVICPQNFRIFINEQELPYETYSTPQQGAEIPVVGDFGGPIVRILRRMTNTFEEISEGVSVSKQDELFIQIVAGTFPTGGYSIEVQEPDIVYPVSGKRGRITIVGKFLRPGKGDVVTQAFTTPTKTVEIGKLPAGEYDIIVKIDGLGEFLRTLTVK
ncbi:protease complex subunit PrcB family protein [Fervidobacterium thailandense]|uniref:PrcB C-terminal domain-containing protein n=1 Tax=Fervidobacterium thailandense TaxID=1008305 RepID=A0A1E3G557_9BACT|nr:protease complex subunit PrcB family protein [Fervidobacterium thailandense]ODN31421.1 hypothetical protein A4H02_01310 [Fervidobacterium thailandense]